MTRYNHDIEVSKLERRLQDKGRYFAVTRETPFYLTSRLEHLRGQADILTIDKDKQRVTYWEVKTGWHPRAIETARKQARKFYEKMEQFPSWKPLFVYYNPKEGYIKRLKQK